jgi:hypothetical protein
MKNEFDLSNKNRRQVKRNAGNIKITSVDSFQKNKTKKKVIYSLYFYLIPQGIIAI